MIFKIQPKPDSNRPASLDQLAEGTTAVLGEFNLPEQVADQLMNLGFLPGLEVTVARSGPGGDPRVYRVDGTEVALRRELTRKIAVLPAIQAESASAKVTTDCGLAPILDLDSGTMRAD